MMEIPAAVKRFVFPLVVALGRMLGKYRMYHDAPKPRPTSEEVRRGS